MEENKNPMEPTISISVAPTGKEKPEKTPEAAAAETVEAEVEAAETVESQAEEEASVEAAAVNDAPAGNPARQSASEGRLQKVAPPKEKLAKAKKKSASALADDAIAYQPDAIELANRKLPWWASHGVLWLFVFFAAMIVWASVSKVDVIVRCQGKVVSLTPNISMGPVDTMILEETLVREGDRVKKGDVLFRFDPQIYQADLATYQELLDKSRPAYLRLKAEFNETDYVPEDPSDRNQIIQKRIFDQRQKNFNARVRYYDSIIESTESQIKSVEQSIENLTQILNTYTDIRDRYRILREERSVAIIEAMQVEMQHVSYQNQLDQYRNALPGYQSQLASNIAERQAYIEEWRQNVASEYNEAEQAYLQYEQQVKKLKRYIEQCELTSPVDAFVHQVAGYAKGSSVREAESIVALIPVSAEYIMEIEIPAKDVSKVHARVVDDNGNLVREGDRVRVKLDPYPFQTWGTMTGELVNISEDTFTRQPSERSAETMMAGNTYYRGQVKITEKFSREPRNFIMKVGMEGSGEVITGKRRIISYIFHPLIKMLDESIREP